MVVASQSFGRERGHFSKALLPPTYFPHPSEKRRKESMQFRLIE
jgi:hypothetical protein